MSVLKPLANSKAAKAIDMIGGGTIYQLRIIYDVPKQIIRSAQAQIAIGIGLLFTPAAPVAAIFIS